MTGERDLDILLRDMRPSLAPEVMVFTTLSGTEPPQGLTPRMTFHEAEGLTLILPRSDAQAHGLDHAFPCRMITLNVHSSLAASGFMARIATELARHDMPVNPVSGYFHDHLFVPEDRAAEAMAILDALSAAGRDRD